MSCEEVLDAEEYNVGECVEVFWLSLVGLLLPGMFIEEEPEIVIRVFCSKEYGVIR